jgi:V/A-type H+-transporting ATPase subunit I
MIVPMKKASIILLDRFRKQSLTELRRLGLLHIESRQAGSEELGQLLEQRNQIERSMLVLPSEPKQDTAKAPRQKPRKDRASRRREEAPTGQGAPAKVADLEESLRIAEEAAACAEKIRSVQEDLDRLQKEQERLAVWGQFEPEEIRGLRDSGIFLRLYEIGERDFRELEGQEGETSWYPFVLSRARDRVRLVAAFLSEDGRLRLQGEPLEEFPLPERGADRVRALQDEASRELEAQQKRLEALARQREQLLAGLRSLNEDIEFEQVRSGVTVAEELSFLTGYLPAGKVDMLKEAAARHGWALLLEEPGPEDPAPTLIQNPRWIQIIKPMFNILGTVAGYREFDISFWFLLFFSLFFAMLIGDAGYGLLLIALTLYARLKMPRAPAGPFALLFVLSGSTVVWGTLTGTWFGIEALSRNPILSRAVLPQIASFGYENTDTFMFICFVIGAIHLSIAHLVSFFRRLPRLVAFADLGWLSMVWGLLFVVRYIVLQQPLNPLAPYLIAPGLLLVILFAEQQGKFFKGLLIGFAKMPLKLLNSISAFSDIISYVRLFAVGLATIEVAKAFNAMAAGIGFGIPSGLIAAVILVFGHTLNILMGAMSVIVHGVRLNMLEFSGHLGMEWTGIPYEPFKEHDIKA